MSRRRPVAATSSRAAPTRKRKRKRKRERAPRRRGRAILQVAAIVVLVVASLVAGGEWLVRQSYFRVHHVSVTGLVHETTAQVLAAAGLASDPPMIDVNTAEVTRRLASLPWIGHVSLTKHWPSTLDLRVREREAVAVAFDPHHRLRYVDVAGHDLGPAPLAANLPTLAYLQPRHDSWPYERAGRGAALVAARLPRAFAAQVSVITEDHAGVVTMRLTTPVSFVLGTATQLHAKFVAVASVIAHETLRPGDVVDVSVPSALAVTGPPPS